jgi:protocatechuate 3,4-dioxygenase alpha subunit
MEDNQSEALFGQTPWQTLGPFFHFALPWRGGADLVGVSDLGARPELVPLEHRRLSSTSARPPVEAPVIVLGGRVLDGQGIPVTDALIETWQAGPGGRFAAQANTGFPGFGRAATDAAGEWHIRTVRPGATPGPNGRRQAPHVAIGVLGRGLLKRLVTRAYFAGAAENDRDAILALVPAERRHTLMARDEGGFWRFDVVLHGPEETVFFEI